MIDAVDAEDEDGPEQGAGDGEFVFLILGPMEIEMEAEEKRAEPIQKAEENVGGAMNGHADDEAVKNGGAAEHEPAAIGNLVVKLLPARKP